MNTPTRILTVFLALATLGLLLLGYSYFIEPRRLVVNNTEIKIESLDPALNGLKIAVIADIHGGSNAVDEAKIRQVVEQTNAQNADLIVLLGDYVSQLHADSSIRPHELKMPMETVAENLQGLSAKYGVFAVLGNHDGWYNDEIVTRELEGAGITVLENKCKVLEINGKPLRLLGLKDHLKATSWKWFSAEAIAALSTCGPNGDVIALEHSPDVLPMITGDLAIAPNLRLILAGHTHGGQVWLPLLGRPIVPSSFGQKYAYGHVKDANVDMFVTSGVGTSILPFRFMVPPEIAVITLRSN
jgi:predicted MPP superfamily phosphohydrolase